LSTDILEVLRTLARSQMRFITVSDLCGALTLPEEECLQHLQDFVDQGLLRATHSQNGQPYFWLTPQLTQE
jgi:DNA-binding IclR family transcriptional regulator